MGVFLPACLADAAVKAHAVVALPGSLDAYAHGLYGFLRELDQQGGDLIVASLPVEEGLGLAVCQPASPGCGAPALRVSGHGRGGQDVVGTATSRPRVATSWALPSDRR